VVTNWERLKRRVRDEFVQPYPIEGASPDQRRNMRWLWWDSLFACISVAFYGDFVNLFLLQLGAKDFQIGLISSATSAAMLLGPLVGTWLVERTRKRKLWVMLGSAWGFRIIFFILAGLPFILNGAPMVTIFIVLYSLQSFATSLGMPAWNSLLGDIVPLSLRGRFLGATLTLSFIARLGVVPLAGIIVQSLGSVGGYQMVWLLAGLTGMVATYFYGRIKEPTSLEVESHGIRDALLGSFTVLGRDRRFFYFCLVSFVWNFGIMLAGPYFNVHQVQTLGFSVTTITYILTIAAVVAAILVRFAGGLVDRYGPVKLMLVSMAMIPIIPLMWLAGRTPVHIGIIQCLAEFAWSGSRVAATPLLLLLSPVEQRSRYFAAYNTMVSLALVLGPLPAGWIYSNYGFSINLVVSAAGRGLAAILFGVLVWRGGLGQLGAQPVTKPDAVEPDAVAEL